MSQEFVPETLHAASFGKLIVYGLSYRKRGEPAGAKRFWLLTLQEPSTPENPNIVNEYWVSGSEFHRVPVDVLFDNGTLRSAFGIEDALAEPSTVERQAALSAIAKWEMGATNREARLQGS